MKSKIIVLLIAVACAGWIVVHAESPDTVTGPKENKKTRLLSAPPMPSESLGLFLETETRKGPYGAPYKMLCNIRLHHLNNTSIPIWKFPRITFYAEQDGQFFALRRTETHTGGLYRPYSMISLSLTLPRPPRPGKWQIFAIQEHSENVYGNYLEFNSEKTSIVFAEDQDDSYSGMWTTPLISNSIVVEFAELDDNEMKIAESIIEGYTEARQYDPDFREPEGDPRRQFQK